MQWHSEEEIELAQKELGEKDVPFISFSNPDAMAKVHVLRWTIRHTAEGNCVLDAHLTVSKTNQHQLLIVAAIRARGGVAAAARSRMQWKQLPTSSGADVLVSFVFDDVEALGKLEYAFTVQASDQFRPEQLMKKTSHGR